MYPGGVADASTARRARRERSRASRPRLWHERELLAIMVSPVYFYVPNLIGYVRVVLAFVGYGAALTDYRVTVVAYLLSQLLDAADGYAARKLGQSSTYGAVLDMVTDRSSTMCLCVVLAHFYPQYIVGLTALVTLDLFSHWFHMYASLIDGQGSHKDCTNPLLRFYYWKPVLFSACAGTELWYNALYMLAWVEGPPLPLLGGMPAIRALFYVCSPICAFKQVANVVQMVVAFEVLMAHDAKKAKAKKH